MKKAIIFLNIILSFDHQMIFEAHFIDLLIFLLSNEQSNAYRNVKTTEDWPLALVAVMPT